VVVGCNQVAENTTSSASSPGSNTSASPTSLTISAAASLKDAMDDIKTLYTPQNLNTNLSINYASSGALQQQIEQGAPVDIFISAAEKQMNALENKGLLLDGTRENLLKNEMVLIEPANAQAVTDFKDLTSERVKKIALGEPKSVPAGQYAQEVLTSLKLIDKIKPKVVYASNVRQVLNYVETGNVDAGLVYSSDAKSSNKIKVVKEAPEETHSPIVYPIAVLKSSKNPDAAKDLIQFLTTNEQAKSTFEKWGFSLANTQN
jgi:molybdate transport system substrate-binding protein